VALGGNLRAHPWRATPARRCARSSRLAAADSPPTARQSRPVRFRALTATAHLHVVPRELPLSTASVPAGARQTSIYSQRRHSWLAGCLDAPSRRGKPSRGRETTSVRTPPEVIWAVADDWHKGDAWANIPPPPGGGGGALRFSLTHRQIHAEHGLRDPPQGTTRASTSGAAATKPLCVAKPVQLFR